MAPSPFSPGGYGDRVRRGITQPTLGGPLDTRTRTFGGAYGNPGAQPLPFERPAQPPAVGLGMAPANQAQFAEQIHAQNPGGHLFGGTLPTMVSTAAGPRPGFMSEPMRDMSQKPQFPHQDYTTTPSGALTPRSPSQGMVMSPDQQAKLAAGRQAYLSQRQGVIGQRQAGVTARAQQKAEARRVRQGALSFEERLAAMKPAAAQGRAATEAQAKAAQLNFNSRLAVDRERIAAGERMATERNASNERVAGAKIDAESGPKPPPPSPFKAAPNLPQQTTAAVREATSVGDTEAARQALAQQGIVDRSEQNRIIQESSGDPQAGLGFWERPVPGTGAPGRAPMTRGEAAGRFFGGFLGPGGREMLTPDRFRDQTPAKPAPKPNGKPKRYYVSPFLF